MRLPRAQRLALGKRLYVGLLGQRLCRFDEFIEPLPDPSFIFNFSMWSLGADNKRERRLGWAVFDIAMPIALDLLGTNKARSFTSADMTILRPTIRQFKKGVEPRGAPYRNWRYTAKKSPAEYQLNKRRHTGRRRRDGDRPRLYGARTILLLPVAPTRPTLL
jgi:hypothetical protein